MPDQDPNAESTRRTLSEISHLFLSDVRDRHTGGAPRPQRVPPGQRPAAPIEPVMEPADPELAPVPPVSAIISAHFGGGQPARVRQYARYLAGRIGRVGLIEIDGADVQITCFEPAGDNLGFGVAPFPESEIHDPRALAEAIEELDWDVRHWLLAPTNHRAPEIRSLLNSIGHWALLSTCDHDGVVASYRALKGLGEAALARRPLLTLSLLDAGSEAEMARVFGKLSDVCRQFLDWPVEPEPAVLPAPGVTEDLVLVFQPDASSAEGSGAWAVLEDLVARANSQGEVASDAEPRTESDTSIENRDGPSACPELAERARPGRHAPALSGSQPASDRPVDNCRAPTEGRDGPSACPELAERARPERRAPAPSEYVMNEQPRPTSVTTADPASTGIRLTPDSAVPAGAEPASARASMSEVLGISSEGTAESILAAVLSRPQGGLVECPVRTPMCPSARLTIDRDRRVILLAVAREGLAELRSIGQAYRWLIENRALIAMAVPQLAIDAHQFPRLRLLVDQADASADALQPMLQSAHVTVQAYRRLRWGDRTGLLLDAA